MSYCRARGSVGVAGVHVDPGVARLRLVRGGGAGRGAPARHSALRPGPLEVRQCAGRGVEGGGVVVDHGGVYCDGHVDVDGLLRGCVLFGESGGDGVLLQ